MNLPPEIKLILEDRESGSVALLNQIVNALEAELNGANLSAGKFQSMVEEIRKELTHFAAIENFLVSMLEHSGPKQTFPGEALQFIADYSQYWQHSEEKIAENFQQLCKLEGKTLLTHSHSQTVISLLTQLHQKQIPFRVLQTLSSPGEEGKKSFERMCQMHLEADLIDDKLVAKALSDTDLVLMGCDALLSTEFLNKTGTRLILEEAEHLNIPSYLVTESRKEITHTNWQKQLLVPSLFEWVPLHLIRRIVSEK